MTNKDYQKKIILKIEEQLKAKVVDIQIPPQGMDSDVFFIRDNTDNEYAIKQSEGSISDVLAHELLKKNKIDIPVPKLIGTFSFDEKQVLILEKVNFPLLESVPIVEMHRYIPSMIKNLKKIHQIKSDQAGLLTQTEETSSWKEIMLSKFSGADSSLNWKEIVLRKGLDAKLILKSVDDIIKKIEKIEFIDHSYSLLHTDFNQRNLFINPSSDEITAIIDWGEAMFGDPIYDFARIRMFIWHFNLGNNVLEDYYKLLSFTSEQKQLEELYWLSRVIEYLAYYSEELDEFNVGRIKLHQDFLKEYRWKN